MTATSASIAGPGADGGAPGRGLRPDRAQGLDLGFAGVLLLVAAFAFRSTFAGGEELIVGVPTVVLASVTAYVTSVRRDDLLLTTAVSVLVFVLAAPAIAVRGDALMGFLPSPAALSAVATGLIAGWARLLTSVPPAGQAGSLLMVPYTVVFVGSLLTVSVAVRRPAATWAVLGPVAVLVTGILFGTRVPVSVWLHGVAFGATTLAWATVRSRRARAVTVIDGDSRTQLLVWAATLAGVALVGGLVGPLLPGADRNPRFVLREVVEPPFDPLNEPSPLAGYRLYTGSENEEKEVLTVEGLPPGVPIRLAVLDDYDGQVWRATGDGTNAAGRFTRVGSSIPDVAEGEQVELQMTVLEPHGSWLATVGDVVRVDLGNDDRNEQLRFNLTTETAAITAGGPTPGESYTLTTVLPQLPGEDELSSLAVDPRYAAPTDEYLDQLADVAAQLRGTAEAPYARVRAMAQFLRDEGKFSDGGLDARPATPPGHYLGRVARFLGGAELVGNGEQYAATLALLAAADGIPTRVVMGFRPQSTGGQTTVTGADVAAWVEVPLVGVGWVPVDGTPPEDQLPNPDAVPQPQPRDPDPQPPPPPNDPPPVLVPQDLEGNEDETEDNEDNASTVSRVVLVSGGVIGLLALLVGLIVAYKQRRRLRRRQAATPRAQAVGGWQELLDVALDLGRPVPPRSTRSEASGALRAPTASAVAAATDTFTFGADEPTVEDIDRLWAAVDEALGEIRGETSTLERLRAAISLNSLRWGRM